jgi:hypothetical protein
MKKIILFILSVTLLTGCKDNKIEEKIQGSILTEYMNPPKLNPFLEVGSLKGILTNKSSLQFNEWQKSKFLNGDEKWSSSTAIIQFGAHSNNGFQNDIGYALYGKEKEYCNEIQIVLNVKNSKKVKEALSTLSVWSEQTLAKLNIKAPDNLNESILNRKQFAYEDESSFIMLQKQKKLEINHNVHPKKALENEVTYNRWKLIVKSK